MKKLMISTAAVLLLLGTSSVGFAQQSVFLGPATGSMAITPIADGNIEPVPAEAVTLYSCVRVKDSNDIHPCAVPLVVQIKDPCPPCESACQSSCGCQSSCQSDCGCAPACGCAPPPQCVYVQICVPPCGCPKITCRRDGGYLKYDYGKYEIKITSRKGVITVNYDD